MLAAQRASPTVGAALVVPRHRMWLVSVCDPVLAADLVVNRKN